MSKNKSSKPSFDAHSQDATGSADDAYSPIAGSLPEDQVAPERVAPIPPGLASAADSDWEAVDLPGTVTIAADDSEAIATDSATSDSATSDSATSGSAISGSATSDSAHDPSSLTAKRENELLSLIHDLNECNDALLARISQTESALENAQSALQAEIERAKVAQAKMIEQMSADQASVQQISQTAQQQIAKLVSKLDTTEQALQRQQLINETLQAELNDHQERVTQLEKESALISQQHAEAAQARIQAETVSRDLRSRLQRQQRYTLQFKAALEKSLTVKARPVYTASIADTQPVSYPSAPAVTMPRAQRIMPWVSAGPASFTGIDPHLETLIRNASTPASEPINCHEPPKAAAPQTKPTANANPAATTDLEAEDKLWQDLDRVMNGIDETPASAADTASLLAGSSDKAEAATPRSTKLNWQAAAQLARATEKLSETQSERPPEKPPEKPPTAIEPQPAEAIAAKVAAKVEESFAAATGQLSAEEIGFTEPSPWGKPLPESAEEAVAETTDTTTGAPSTDYSPLGYSPLNDQAGSTVSPLVKSVRSHKKVSSMAAVQLPTFQKAKTGSFRR